MYSCPRPTRTPETGGITIIVALILVSVMGAAALGLSRSSIRDLAITGTVIQGTKADKAADAGLDWFITWAHSVNTTASAGAASAPGLLSNALGGLKLLEWRDANYVSGVFVDRTNKPWDRAAYISSDISSGATNDMVFDTADGALVRQSTAAGNAVIQKFDIEVRYLGGVQTQGTGDPSGGTDVSKAATKDLLWQAIARGSANIPAAGITFTQTREIFGQQSLSQ